MSPLTALQLYIICILSFFVAAEAVIDHPEWFNGPQAEVQYAPTPQYGWQ